MRGIQILCPASRAGVTARAVASSWAGPVRNWTGSLRTRVAWMASGNCRAGRVTARKDVDAAGADGGDGRVGVEEGHDVEFDPGMCAVEVARQSGRREASADHIDAQRTAAGPHGGRRPFRGPEEITGMGQERLPVDGEVGSARGAGEQPYAEAFLQRGDALGDGLLRDRQPGGGLPEPPGVDDGDEGAPGMELRAHANQPSRHNLWL